jgi:beta-N-acetylhexosaminidase
MVLPRVARTRSDLLRTDVAPFRAAIAARIPCLMTAHVVYGGLDPANPASLSPTIVAGLLRRRLGFRGVVVSDDLEMGALSRRLPPEESAARAIAAGSDLLLVCSNLDVARRARQGLEKALQTGTIPAARFREALARTRRLRRRSPAAAPIRTWPCAAHTKLVQDVVTASR